MLSYEYIQFLNDKILDYLPSTFTKVGNKYNGRCFLCGDSHKSTRKKRGWFYTNNASYYCFNCGQSLSGIKMLEILSGENYETIRKDYTRLFLKSGLNPSLSSTVDIPSDEPTIFKLKSIIKPEWKNQLSEKALTYLEQRRVLEAPFLDQKLYSCYSKNKNEEFILIPWIINGCEAYYQINDFQKLHSIKYIFPKDKKKLISGLDNIDISWPYIICFEGFYDSIFVKNGICLGTKSITNYQLKLIKSRYPHHHIVIAFDNDTAGIESMSKLLRDEQKTDFKYFKWFDSNTKEKDINDFIIAQNDVTIFSNTNLLEKLIVDKLTMKMFLIKNNLWTTANNTQYKQFKSSKSNKLTEHTLSSFLKSKRY